MKEFYQMADNMLAEAHSKADRPLRRPATGGYPNGDATRSRIITAAIEMFGDRGYLGASTRDIAAAAGIKPPALQYYFVNKPGLFTACIERVTERIWQRLGPVAKDAEDLARLGVDSEALIASYCRLQDAMIDSFFADAEGHSIRLLSTETDAGAPVDARKLVEHRLGRPLFRARARIVSRIIGRPPADQETLLSTFALAGLIAHFHVSHGSVIRVLGWHPGDAANAAIVKPVLRQQAKLLLEGMARDRGTWRPADRAVGSRKPPGPPSGTKVRDD